nr:Mfa1 family fimbria major subunit [Prevotella sp.]
MRIKHFFGLAVLAAMTASCSSNNDLVNGGNGSGENESGVGYASFSINLPTTRGTRATDPTFDKGDAKEYDVFNATLLVFKQGEATSEGNYTLAETVDLGSMEPWKDQSETGVTTQAKITAKLENVDTNDNYFALVLLNNGSGTDAKVTLPSEGEKFSAWNVAAKANPDKFTDTKKGFYMANAPLYNSTDKNVTTLVAIDKNKIFPTEAQASSGEAAADIYVERGLAKVTLTAATKDEKPVATSSSYAGDMVKISNWALDVTNLKTFPIHNVDELGYEDIWKNEAAASGPSTLRFVDNNPETLVKRVYWGKDPNYSNSTLNTDETARAAEFNYVTANTEVTADPTKPLYCLENTFNLENMKQGQTTRVIFKASYTPKGFTTEDGNTFYKVGTSVALWKQKDLEAHIKAAVTKVISDATKDNTLKSVTIKLDAENDITAAGNHEIKASNISVTGHTVTDAEVKAVNEKVGLTEKAGISTYANGESYYIARIKHFGDALTPWKSGDLYGTNNLAYLGRYGMLRNNWYELDVQSVSGPGYPDVPEVKPNTPDDEDDKYIKVSVKILDWAKRSQDVNL